MTRSDLALVIYLTLVGMVFTAVLMFHVAGLEDRIYELERKSAIIELKIP